MQNSIIILISFITFFGCDRSSQIKSQVSGKVQNQKIPTGSLSNPKMNTLVPRPIITFVELGSVNCIPCKKMQPVMKSIEEKYTNQIEVIFYDVWKAAEKKYAQQYKVKTIPTQVFLDSTGVEIMRHIGFFPEKEIDKFLQSQGLISVKRND
jgi:thioredoxin 1